MGKKLPVPCTGAKTVEKKFCFFCKIQAETWQSGKDYVQSNHVSAAALSAASGTS